MGEVVAQFPPNCHPQVYWTYLARKYDLHGLFYMDLWPITYPSVVLIDKDLIHQTSVVKPLAKHKIIDDFLSPVTGHDNIAASNGAVWKKSHNILAPAFSASNVKDMVPTMSEECVLFRETLNRYAKTGEVFSMEHTAAALIFDVIARLVFNFPLHAQTKGSSYLTDLRGLIHVVEGLLSLNPLMKVKQWWSRLTVVRRMDRAILNQIRDRFELLKSEKATSSKKGTRSVLDLMLLDQLKSGVTHFKDLDRSFLESSVTK
jgi:cytochrome P450